ncbi:hypothetical protein ECHHL_0213 [Ehrlichia chaffeensis str. Heartland]|nr:hypothetical protein ECHHL_0213 [Ehrlichia chaffeensis str. Heartland]AHX05900.1 hypothetical protein ECHJAX_0844 [Ehrlichia chaffeensis str. Jax]AHX06892.1 hypothetical protein ECHLIB_0848 [Ehrlichia chaffeensis str. Liberty]AHX07920.1 hypothetical protein ECHOSC_0221 [Ehrlichia chaffeensis str. Osceola]AHX08677.1 hypothetical protein ECHSTV_0834 [Ehrlichia chaffeensis str. Saint Vincent]AHX09494.1 hypothetical protein ECHWAK_0841 [Ehrlichia chaffeensis str. Wakulla]AHX10274.1 hypothetica
MDLLCFSLLFSMKKIDRNYLIINRLLIKKQVKIVRVVFRIYYMVMII